MISMSNCTKRHHDDEIWCFGDLLISIQHEFASPELWFSLSDWFWGTYMNYSAKKAANDHYFWVQLYSAEVHHEDEIWHFGDPFASIQHESLNVERKVLALLADF